MFSLQTSTRRTWRASTMGLSASCWVATVGPCSPSPLLPNNFLLPNLLPTLLPRPPHSCWASWLSLLHLSRSGLKTFLAEVTFSTQTVSKVTTAVKKGWKECKKWAKKMAKARNFCLGDSFFLLSLKTSTDCEDWGRNKSCHHRAPNNSQPLSEPSSSGLWKKRESGFSLRNDGESGRRVKPCPAALLTALYMTFSLLSFTNRLDLLMWGDRECLEPTQTESWCSSIANFVIVCKY